MRQVFLFLTFTLICFTQHLKAQTTIYTQDFETLNTGYTASNTNGSSTTNTFNRVQANFGGNSTFVWIAEDMDDAGVSGTGETLVLDQIDVTGYDQFRFNIDFLTPNINDWDGNTELLITYSIDGGSSQDLMWVQNTDGTNNEPASLDLDFDGNGDCALPVLLPALSNSASNDCAAAQNVDTDFQTFNSGLINLSSNSTLDITITFNNMTAGDEGIYFDNISVEGLVTSSDTEVEFSPTEYDVFENAGTQPLSVSITNPSMSSATTVDVVLVSGNAADIDNYSTQTLTFPAGSSAAQTATITITDDMIAESLETFEFELQNVSGGTNATIGAEDIAELDITDNDSGNNAPTVTYVSDTSGGSVTTNTSVTVTMQIIDDNSNIQNPTLNYNFNPTDGSSMPQSGSLSLIATGSNDQFTATIPGFNEAGTAEFIASANDEINNVGQSTLQDYTVTGATGVVQLPIIINEVSQGATNNQEWVELLVIEDGLDLRGYDLGDNDDGTFGSDIITFRNIAQWAAVPAGTIIVVYNGSDVDSTLTPDTDFSDFSVTIASNNAFYFTGMWARYSDSDRDDGPAIRDTSDVIVHDFVNQPSANVITPLAGNARAYTGDDAEEASVADNNNWSTITANMATPGAGNGGDNSVFVNTLRGRVTYEYTGGIWSPAVPEGNASNQDIVIIQDGSYAITGDIDVLDLIISSGASLDLGTNSLNLAGSLEQNGTLIANEATINAGGSLRQEIDGNDFEVDTFILNNASGLVLNSNLSINSTLRLQNGELNLGGDVLTFLSSIVNNQPKTAVLDEVGSGSINGDVRVQQFYPSNRSFRFISSSVNMSGGLFANWQQSGRNPGDANYEAGVGTQITGGTSNGFDVSGTNNPSAFTFDNVAQSWSPITFTQGNALNAGDPLRMLIRGDRSVDLNAAPGTAVSSDTTLETEGELVIGAFRFASSNAPADAGTLTSAGVQLSEVAGEFNLLGNPYQAQVNMGQVFADLSTTNIVEGSYVIWDPTTGATNRPGGSGTTDGIGQYVTYDFVTGASTNLSDVNAFIQPGQAVFVQTENNGASTLQFRESFKVDDPFTTTVYDTNNITSLNVWMLETSEVGSGLPARDGVLMKFGSQFLSAYKVGEDVVKFNHPSERLSVVHDRTNVSLMSDDEPVDGDRLQLNIDNLNSSSYTFRIQNDFGNGMQVFLVDNFLNNRQQLTIGMNDVAKSFDLNDPSSIAIDRFHIEFVDTTLNSNEATDELNVNVYPNPVNDILNVNGLLGGQKLEISIYSTTGQLVKNYSKETSSSNERISGFDSLNNGLYLLTVKEGERKQTIQLIKK